MVNYLDDIDDTQDRLIGQVARQLEALLLQHIDHNPSKSSCEGLSQLGWWLMGEEFDGALCVALGRLSESLVSVVTLRYLHQDLTVYQFQLWGSNGGMVAIDAFPQVPRDCPVGMELYHIVSGYQTGPVMVKETMVPMGQFTV